MRMRSLVILVALAFAVTVAAVSARGDGPNVLRSWFARLHGVAGH